MKDLPIAEIEKYIASFMVVYWKRLGLYAWYEEKLIAEGRVDFANEASYSVRRSVF